MAKANKTPKEKTPTWELAFGSAASPEPRDKAKQAKKGQAKKVGKPDKAKREPKDQGKPAPVVGITGVDLETLPPGESASCAFDPATGRLTLRLPRTLDGRSGPQGPPGAPGLRGMAGEAGIGVDYTRAPGGADDYDLFVDEDGQLHYHARGRIALVQLDFKPQDAVDVSES